MPLHGRYYLQGHAAGNAGMRIYMTQILGARTQAESTHFAHQVKRQVGWQAGEQGNQAAIIITIIISIRQHPKLGQSPKGKINHVPIFNVVLKIRLAARNNHTGVLNHRHCLWAMDQLRLHFSAQFYLSHIFEQKGYNWSKFGRLFLLLLIFHLLCLGKLGWKQLWATNEMAFVFSKFGDLKFPSWTTRTGSFISLTCHPAHCLRCDFSIRTSLYQ